MNLEKNISLYHSTSGVQTRQVLFITCYLTSVVWSVWLYSGFPPADGAVRDFLTTNGSERDSYDRACAFLEALFEHTAKILQNDFKNIDAAKLASEFRKRMTKGQTFEQHNSFRVAFYDDVIKSAKKKFESEKVLATVAFMIIWLTNFYLIRMHRLRPRSIYHLSQRKMLTVILLRAPSEL